MEPTLLDNSDDNELRLSPDPFLEISCPFLGVRDDPNTPMGYPTADNYCYAFKTAKQIDLVTQRRHCLSDCYTECSIYQQKTAAVAKKTSGEFKSAGRFPRIVNGRTLALAIMLILIVLAVLIWWPPPGTSMKEGTVFGISFNLNTPNVEDELKETPEQADPSQQNSEANLTDSDEDSAADVQEPSPSTQFAEKADEVKRFSPLEKSTNQEAAPQSPAVEDVDISPKVSSLPPAEQSALSDIDPEEIANETSPAADVEMVVEETPIVEAAVDKNKIDEASTSDAAQSAPPDDNQAFQSPAEEGEEPSEKQSGFTPISYEDQGSDEEMVNVYQSLGSGNYIRIARPELFNLLGRNATAEWIKISTESGVEGWILVSETELGNWVQTLSEIEP